MASGHRGKRPVPLPRRLSSISSASVSPGHSSTSSHVATPITPSPSPISGGSSQSSSPSHFFARSSSSAKKSAAVASPVASVSTSTPGRRKGSSSSDVPTPTANFKSYRRVPPSKKQPAPPAPPASAKLKSVTRLSFDSAPGQARRADSGLGHTSISSADSVSRLSSVSSTESSSPVRILVRQDPARPRRPSSQYYEP